MLIAVTGSGSVRYAKNFAFAMICPNHILKLLMVLYAIQLTELGQSHFHKLHFLPFDRPNGFK